MLIAFGASPLLRDKAIALLLSGPKLGLIFARFSFFLLCKKMNTLIVAIVLYRVLLHSSFGVMHNQCNISVYQVPHKVCFKYFWGKNIRYATICNDMQWMKMKPTHSCRDFLWMPLFPALRVIRQLSKNKPLYFSLGSQIYINACIAILVYRNACHKQTLWMFATDCPDDTRRKYHFKKVFGRDSRGFNGN